MVYIFIYFCSIFKYFIFIICNQNISFKIREPWTSLVVQWIRICLLVQGHRFDPWSRKITHVAAQMSPCATTSEPMLSGPQATAKGSLCCNYWSPRTLEPASSNYWVLVLLKPIHLEAMLWSKRSHMQPMCRS